MKDRLTGCCIPFLPFLTAISIITAADAQPAGDSDFLESLFDNRDDIVFYGGFEKEGVCSDQWESSWGIAWSQRCDQIETLTGEDAFIGDKTIRVHYPAGEFGPAGTGAQFPITFERMTLPETGFDSLYLRYYLQFEEGFDFRLGGKLPGLIGGDESWGVSGGNHPDGTNGWTLRLMWRENGMAVVYAYLPPGEYQQGSWGLDIALNKQFKPGTWHCIEQFVCINDIGRENGALRVWFDNELVLDLDDVVYRTVENSAGKVGGCYFSTFHGGSGAQWAPLTDSYARFDGFTMATSRVGLFDSPVDTRPPDAPGGISATATTENRIDLSWQPSNDLSGVSHYCVYDENDSLISESKIPAFAVRNLTPETHYCFTITATDSAGNTSDKSSPTCATTSPPGQAGQIDSVTLIPVADSYVRGGSAGQNYGSETGLAIKTESSAANNRRAYLKFDLGRISGIVANAQLSLQVTSTWGEQMRCVAADVDDDSWEENEINYSNSPPFSEMIDSVWVTQTGPIMLDLTAISEQEARGDGILSIALLELAGVGGSIGSRESSNPPKLVIYYYPDITVSNKLSPHSTSKRSRSLPRSYRQDIPERDNIEVNSPCYDALGRYMKRMKRWNFHVVESKKMD